MLDRADRVEHAAGAQPAEEAARLHASDAGHMHEDAAGPPPEPSGAMVMGRLLSTDERESLQTSLRECVTQQQEVREALAMMTTESSRGMCAEESSERQREQKALQEAYDALEIAIRSLRKQLSSELMLRQQQQRSYVENKKMNIAAKGGVRKKHSSPGGARGTKSRRSAEHRRQRHHDVNGNSGALPADCKFSYGETCWPGRRDNLEDRCTIAVPLVAPFSEPESVWYYFGVFDGHGGTSAADFASKHLHHDFLRCWRQEARGRNVGSAGHAADVRNEEEDPKECAAPDGTGMDAPVPADAANVLSDGIVAAAGGCAAATHNNGGQMERGPAHRCTARAEGGDDEASMRESWQRSDEEESVLIGSALKSAFERCDKNFLFNAERVNSPCGTTALVCLISKRTGTLVTANAGDCRAILSIDGNALDISEDHKPNLREERRRIEANGGSVKCLVGTWRVTRGGDINALAPHNRVWLSVSRGIGDLPLKRPSLLVSCEPDIFVNCPPGYTSLGSNDGRMGGDRAATAGNTVAGGATATSRDYPGMMDGIAPGRNTSNGGFTEKTAAAGDARRPDVQPSVDPGTCAPSRPNTTGACEADGSEETVPEMKLLIMACDGVYDVLSSQEAVEAALEGLILSGSVSEAASSVVRTAYNAGSEDNLSCVVVVLDDHLNSRDERSREKLSSIARKQLERAKKSAASRDRKKKMRLDESRERSRQDMLKRQKLQESRDISRALECNWRILRDEAQNHQALPAPGSPARDPDLPEDRDDMFAP